MVRGRLAGWGCGAGLGAGRLCCFCLAGELPPKRGRLLWLDEECLLGPLDREDLLLEPEEYDERELEERELEELDLEERELEERKELPEE